MCIVHSTPIYVRIMIIAATTGFIELHCSIIVAAVATQHLIITSDAWSATFFIRTEFIFAPVTFKGQRWCCQQSIMLAHQLNACGSGWNVIGGTGGVGGQRRYVIGGSRSESTSTCDACACFSSAATQKGACLCPLKLCVRTCDNTAEKDSNIYVIRKHLYIRLHFCNILLFQMFHAHRHYPSPNSTFVHVVSTNTSH